MSPSLRWWRNSVGVATLAAGLLVAGCDSGSSGGGSATATVNLNSLPAAEAWVDGKPAGSTPLAIPLSAGRHEVVLKQAGFSEHRETLDVAAGSVASVDATLLPDDPMDPDALRQIAAAYGITVEPFRAPEVHRGAAAVGGVALLFPRNDVRKEGLLGYRIDVTPAYEGGGFLEFRKGKTSLYREKFEPETLVNASNLPKAVLDAVKTGDRITWGVYFSDARKPITAQFEVVAKPTASKKLAELSADRRLAAQPAALRQQLEAEVLQNYRLYSEALVRLLDMRAADKDNTSPYTGIVSCLRRLDLEDTALFSEAASKAMGVTSRNRGVNAGAGLPGKRNPVGTMPAAGAPVSDPVEAAPSAPLAGPASPAVAPGATATPSPRNAPSDATSLPASPNRETDRAPGTENPARPGALATPPVVPTAPVVPTLPVGPTPPTPQTPSTGMPAKSPVQPGATAPTPPTPALPTQPTPPSKTEPTLPTPPSKPVPTLPTPPSKTEPTLPTPPSKTEPTLPTPPSKPVPTQPTPPTAPVPPTPSQPK